MQQEPKLISFKEWMAHNNRSYYSRHAPPGKEGDFITSPAVHPAFGEAIALQILEMDETLGHPDPFVLMEFGGGNGQLALDILKGLSNEFPDFLNRLNYTLSDFPEAIQNSRERIEQTFPEVSDRMKYFPAFGSGIIAGLPVSPECVIANEFLDALPVHLIVKRGTEFREIFIAENQDHFEIVELPLQPSSELLRFIQSNHIDLEDGTFAEINLEMRSWIRTISSSLKRGFVLVLDYGGPGDELRSDRYPKGTLRGFKNHKLADVFTLQLGDGDWTSDIDFSILTKLAEQEGFSVTGYSTQGNFLLGLGIAERLPLFVRKKPTLDDIKEHLAMKFLFHPEGLGNAFNVLGLHKGMPQPKLSGFSMRQEKL